MREMETERFPGAEKEAEAKGGWRGWKPPWAGQCTHPPHPASVDSLRVCPSLTLHTHAVYGGRTAGAPLCSAPFTPDKTLFAWNKRQRWETTASPRLNWWQGALLSRCVGRWPVLICSISHIWMRPHMGFRKQKNPLNQHHNFLKCIKRMIYLFTQQIHDNIYIYKS